MKRRSLHERSSASAIRNEPCYYSTDWVRQALRIAWLAGYSAARRDAKRRRGRKA